MFSSFLGMGLEKRLFFMFLLLRKYIISFGVKSLNIVGRESNIISFEEEGFEECLEFLRFDCFEYVWRNLDILVLVERELVGKKEIKRIKFIML